jgi:cobalamin biosynthetic protein CobC
MAVKHGGNLLDMAQHFGGDAEQWLDLSTGVSPFTYPVGALPLAVWNQLPQHGDGLEAAAKAYYQGSEEPLSVAGSQAAIMALPSVLAQQLGRCAVVALPRVGYKEHEQAWRTFKMGDKQWELCLYDDRPTVEQIERSDVVVVINPNNPSGHVWERDELLELHGLMAQKKGWLLVDEAFIDTRPERSMLGVGCSLNHLIVLRSVGKFFGLAGARVGFVFCEEALKEQLVERLGPWTVTGPSRWAVAQALKDDAWQQQARAQIIDASARLNTLLEQTLALPMVGSDLFTTVLTPWAQALHIALCEQQVLTRLCDEGNAIRFGLPGNESQWQQLRRVLANLT